MSRVFSPDPALIAEKYCDRWHALSQKYLPVTLQESLWRYSRTHRDSDLRQGWKLHISSTILSACQTLTLVAPFLHEQNVLFKGPISLVELQRINAGVLYGYSQVGKFITVYPRSNTEARSLAKALHKLTRGLQAPAIPFDSRFRKSSVVFYRYGSFDTKTVEDSKGLLVPAMCGASGELVPDDRYSTKARPDWISPLFKDGRRVSQRQTLLSTTYRTFESIAQRGKGGVYKVFDFSVQPPRIRLMKEGRYCGETSWDSQDGAWLMRNEERVLQSLARAGVPVPKVFKSFRLNRNQYLVTEFIEGRTLSQFLIMRQRRLSLARVKALALQLSSLMVQIHEAGWAWRDCKPANLILTNHNLLRPIDFEGACPLLGTEQRIWSTPGFTPDKRIARSGRLADIYAFGVVIYYLLTAELPLDPNPESVRSLRKHVPNELVEFLRMVLAPRDELTSQMVFQKLNKVII